MSGNASWRDSRESARPSDDTAFRAIPGPGATSRRVSAIASPGEVPAACRDMSREVACRDVFGTGVAKCRDVSRRVAEWRGRGYSEYSHQVLGVSQTVTDARRVSP